MRIKSSSAQVGYILIFVLGISLILVPLGVIDFTLGFCWAVVALVVAALVSARTFRGGGEPDSARPWWKMTNTRAVSILLCAYFILQGAYVSFGASRSPNPPLVLAGGVVFLIVAAMYLNSAIRIPPVSHAVRAPGGRESQGH